MKNAPMKHIADQLATHGRYGDTMLVHMNPHEVAGIASLAPGGKLTINPVTGQPEAFLPFLAPLLGGWLGSAAAGAGLLGSLGTVAGSAIGSGLATTLATGDLEQGLLSGLTGFGLGSALSGLGSAAGTAGTAGVGDAGTSLIPSAEQMTQNFMEGIKTGGVDAATGMPNALLPTKTTGALGAPPVAAGQPTLGGVPVDFSGQGIRSIPGAFGENPDSYFTNLAKNQYNSAMDFNPDVILKRMSAPGYYGEGLNPPKPTFTEALKAPFSDSGALLKSLSKPENFLPMYIGEGTNAGIRAQKMNEEAMSRYKREQEEEGSKARQGILRALQQVRTDYGMYGGGQVDYAGGGQVGYAIGGSFGNIIDSVKNKGVDPADAATEAAVENFYGAYGGPSGLQSSLRGSVLNTPPAFDYNALFSGGSGYAPGIAPEFMFFGNPTPGGGGTGGGGTGGGGLPPPPVLPPTPPSGPGAGGGSANFFVNRPQGNFGYIRAPATSETDIGSILDRLSQNQDESVFEELTRQPPRMFAEGGPVEPTMAGLDMIEGADPIAPASPIRAEYDNLVKMTIAAIKGQVEDPEAIIQRFVDEYGNEAFMQLRESVLQTIQPGAQTQGLVDGEGGGMDDLVQGSIADGRPVAVSPGEYIIPADVVSAAGDGYTNSGAKYFDDLIESIRTKKNGTSEQPKPMKDIMG